MPITHCTYSWGEITKSSIDEVFEHSITKMSHLYFTASHEYKKRVIQMGEKLKGIYSWRFGGR